MELNKSIFVGRVKDAPQISGEGAAKQAFMKFMINDRVLGESGQWVDRPMDIDVFARDKKADLLEKYVVAGQELAIECKYINWQDGNVLKHAFQMLNVSFGFKPKGSVNPQPAPQNVPPM
jgi:hypothetical protein